MTTDDGLSQSTVNTITQDSDGYIWIGTDEGLNRYSGYDFKVFKSSNSISGSFGDNDVTTLLIDSQERMWVGLSDGSLNLYDKNTETFQSWNYDPKNTNTPFLGSIVSIIEDDNQNLWISSYNGLSCFNYAIKEFTRFPYGINQLGLTDYPCVSAIKKDKHFVQARTNGIAVYSTTDFSAEYLLFDDYPVFNNQRPIVETMIMDDEGLIWLGTQSHGFYTFDLANRSFKRVELTGQGAERQKAVIWCSAKERNGHLLFGTDGSGIISVNPKTMEAEQVLSINYPDLVHENVNCVYLDGENNLWIGTYGRGISFINRNRKKFVHIRYLDDYMKSIDRNSILSIIKGKQSEIWVGTDGSGLYKFVPDQHKFVNFEQLSGGLKLSGTVIKSLAWDYKNNILYAGTYGRGLNVIDLNTNKVTVHLHDPEDSNSLNSNSIWAILIDSEERVWLATLNGGLDEYIPSEGRFEHHTVGDQGLFEISSNHLSTIFEDRDGVLWIGTSGGGINKFDKENLTFSQYAQINEQDTFRTINETNEIYQDSDGTVWFLTQSGIGIYDKLKDSIYSKYSTVPALQYPQSMLEDAEGNYWISTSSSMVRIDRNKGELKIFDYRDGLQGNEFSENARLMDDDGTLIFGGLNGLTVFEPGDITSYESLPEIAITSISLYDNEIPIDPKSDLMPVNPNQMGIIRLSQDSKILSIKYAAIDFHIPKKNEYAYKLQGFDKEWNYVNDNRVATYTNLPPGKHKFLVKATNPDGKWTEPENLITIFILPRWYQIWWVQIGMVLGLAALIMLVTWLRTMWLLKNKKSLERLVEARTNELKIQREESEQKNNLLIDQNKILHDRNEVINKQNKELVALNEEIEKQREKIFEKSSELEKAHEDIKFRNKQLVDFNNSLEQQVEKRSKEIKLTLQQLIKSNETLNTFLYRSSHDLKEPITTLMAFIQLAKKECVAEIEPIFSKLLISSSQMLKLLEKLSQTNLLFNQKNRTSRINWEDILADVRSKLDHSFPGSNVDINMDVNISHPVFTDAPIIHNILYNLVENSIIFKSANKKPFVRLSISNNENILIIKVLDNGIGISPQSKDKIFNMFYRGSEKSIGNGLGLYMVHTAVKNLNGKIFYTVEDDEFTVFNVEIPVEISEETNEAISIAF